MLPVHGLELDEQTRCAHWHSPNDVIAIKFACCGEYYACYDCHAALADHEPDVWPRASYAQPAVLCGVCGSELTIDQYMAAKFTCPSCGAAFNPGCANHYHLYFG
jgi:uncharacterized CHY-type Zn-finger protein